MFDKLLAPTMTSLLTISGIAALSVLSVVSTPLTPSANAQVQTSRLNKRVPQVCKTGAQITQSCVPGNGDFKLMPPGYSANVRTGEITTPVEKLSKPEPRPNGEQIQPIGIQNSR
jgi:hypothetical protein